MAATCMHSAAWQGPDPALETTTSVLAVWPWIQIPGISVGQSVYCLPKFGLNWEIDPGIKQMEIEYVLSVMGLCTPKTEEFIKKNNVILFTDYK